MKNVNTVFSHEKWEYLLNDIIKDMNRKEVEDFVLTQIEKSFDNIDGCVISRNVESADMLYVTAAHGTYSHYLHHQLSRIEGFSGYGLIHRKVFAVNSFHDIPVGVTVYGDSFTEKDRVIVIPLIPANGLLYNPTKIHAVVVLHREHKDFTEEEINRARQLSEHYGYLLDIYYATHLMFSMRHIEEMGRQMITDATSNIHSIREFMNTYVEKAIQYIGGAEAGSLLIEVPGGFKFIAVSGYSTELLDMPPISRHNHLRWYYYGETKMRQGMPRILTPSVIQTLMAEDVVAKESKNTKRIQSTLGIPIIGDGRVVLFINLDSFSSPVAFDDTDIELARQMGAYFTAAYEVLMGRVRTEKRDIVISRLNNLAERLSGEENKYENTPIKDIFIKVVTDGLEILKTHNIVLLSEEHTDKPTFIGQEDEKLLNKIHTLLPIVKINRYAIGIYDKYNLLIVSKDMIAENEHINIYIALTREDIWSRSDLDYIFSIINSAIIYLKNILYLRAIGKTQEETLKMLGKALEMRDIETKGHTERTAQLTQLLAEHMGLKDMKGIMWGAYIHDIGKIAIPDRILLKPGKLTKGEFDVIKRHVIYGYDLIRNIEGLPETTKNVVLYHHERWDGTGYMRGLKGENIPLEARIFAVVDVFDALISERPYKKPWPIDKAIQEIKKNAGTHFDLKVVEAFLEVIHQHLHNV